MSSEALPPPDPGGEGQASTDASNVQRRREIRARNIEALKGRPDLSTLKALDASLKRNTSFIKKLKAGINPENLASLIADIAALKLEKYISEVVVSIAECRLRNSGEVFAAVEVCSAIHQRYADFAGPLLSSLVKQLGPPPIHQLSSVPAEQREKEDAARVSKQRSALRLLVELYLVQFFVDKEKKDGLVFSVVRDMFGNDKTQHINLSLATSFCKFYGSEFFPGSDPPPDAVVGPEQRVAFKALFTDYWNSVIRRLKSDHNRLRDMSRSLADHAIARGDVSEDRQQRYETAMKAYEKLSAQISALAEPLDEKMPELKGLDEETANVTKLTGIGVILDGGSNRAGRDDSSTNLGPWEDEETKFFYESIVDLKDFVPGILLGEKQKDETEGAGEASKDEGDNAEKEDEAQVTETGPPPEEPLGTQALQATPIDAEELPKDEAAVPKEEAEDAEDSKALDEEDGKGGGGSQPQLDALLGRLPNALNRTTIDQIAVEFCYLNNKGARRKLAKALLSVPRQRLDLLPYYARLMAILKPYMPDVITTVSDSLDSDFHRQQRKRDVGFIDDKVKTVRYLAELAKFRLVPLHVTFHCLKVLLDDFGGQNIEVLANFLETCGRFLAKSPDTAQRMSNMLDIMMRKKAVQHLDNRQVMMIENAYYQCNPPDKPAISAKVRSPVEQYVRRLIYFELAKATAEKIVKLLRKLDWDSDEVNRVLFKVMTKIWKVRFSNVHLVAFLVAELSVHHTSFGVRIVDAVLEEIRVGLELNIFKHNQRRIAAVKYLGELYNYRLLDSSTIFDTLYLLVTFGHGGLPRPDVFNPLDAPHDFFRVRLACTLLDTCGSVFAKGSAGKKLDAFLVFLQLYIKTKIDPPLDVTFLIQDTFDLLRPAAKRFETFEEALEAMKELTKASEAAANVGTGTADDEEEDDEGDELDAEGVGKEGLEDSDSLESEDSKGDSSSSDGSDGESEEEEEEAVVVHDQFAKGPSKEEDDEFEKEFNRILQESVESRRSEKRVMTYFDVPIPVRMARQNKQDAAGDDEDSSEGEEASKGVTFSVLTKKGSKQQTRQILLPADSTLAVNTLKKQEADRAEQAALKKLVLHSVSTDADRQVHPPAAATRGGRGKQVLWSNTSNYRVA